MIAGGFVLLVYGANRLVDGASALAKRFHVSGIIIGLTIVALGTSTPELVINLIAASGHNTEIVLGNVVGSNIMNVLVILGVASLIYPLAVQTNTTWIEIPLSLLAALVVLVMGSDIFLNQASRNIIDHIEDKNRIGVCIDTAHAYSAGYDFVSPEGYEKVWNDFERILGWHYLKGLHINDSKKELGSRVDRHDSIGKGTLGTEVFKRIMQDERLDNIPLILETPDTERWKEEIQMLYGYVGGRD